MPIQTLKRKIDELFNAIIDEIIKVSDFFIVENRITLSEALLLLFSSGTAFWLILFNIKDTIPTYQYIYSENLWAFLFSISTIFHVYGIVRQSPPIRVFALRFYAILWFMWSALVGLYWNFLNPTFVLHFLISFTAVILAVRVKRENKNV